MLQRHHLADNIHLLAKKKNLSRLTTEDCRQHETSKHKHRGRPILVLHSYILRRMRAGKGEGVQEGKRR